MIRVQGFSWCKDEPKTISITGLTAKILCTKHNHGLSAIDEAGAKAFHALREMRGLANFRERFKPKQWRIATYRINGVLFERWLLKTLINICCDQEYPIGRESTVPGRPSEELVRIAYGIDPFRGRSGLSFVARVGMQLYSDDSVNLTTLLKNGRIEGGIFTFRGMMILLFLHPDGAPPKLNGIRVDGEDLGNCMLQFHCRKITSKVGHFASQVLTIDWTN